MAPMPTAANSPNQVRCPNWVYCVPKVATNPKKTKTNTSPQPL